MMTSLRKLVNLPAQPTRFIGREDELAEIVARLAQPACRLLTVVGPGGVGKTRLATAVAEQLAGEFADGIVFVNLQSISQTDSLLTAIADALHFSMTGADTPQAQLFSYLHNKEMLLLLDNFEHLLHQATLLTDLLASATAVQLLVTSREALNLQEEWRYPLHGLPVPPEAHENDITDYDAVQLFVERAYRAQPNFSLDVEQEGVVEICRLVEGIPLALELAASWTRLLSCRAIAREIQQDLAFLSTKLRDVAARHRNMQAVFGRTWQMLEPEEQDILKRLSLFRGDFDRAAAAEVAQASLPLLLEFVNKSLLRGKNDRYQLHELLRQYAQEKLTESPTAETKLRETYSSYYTNFLQQRRSDLMGGRQREAAAEIEEELNNIRAAWQWSVAQMQVPQLQKSSQALALFYQMQGRFLEGANTFTAAADSLERGKSTEQHDLTRLQILIDLAWFLIRLGRLARAETVLETCQDIQQRCQIPPIPGHGTDPALIQGIIAAIRGDYATAARLGEAARQVSEKHAHRWNRQFAYFLLAQAAQSQGDYVAAQKYAHEAYAQAHDNGDVWFMAYCYNEMGHAARLQGAYDEARRHYQASFALRESFDDPEGMALALTHLGETAVLRSDYTSAQQLYQQSRQIYQEIDDRGGLATALKGLGVTACAQKAYAQAREYLHEALQIASKIQYAPLLFSLMLSVAELWLQTEQTRQGLELLALARQHPASPQKTRDRAAQLLAENEADVTGELHQAAGQTDDAWDLDERIKGLLAELSLQLDLETAVPINAVKPNTSQKSSDLVEPLTAREQEVLQLLAQGFSNRKIAEKLTITVGTVKSHNHNIYSKLAVSNRTQAVTQAQELGLL